MGVAFSNFERQPKEAKAKNMMMMLKLLVFGRLGWFLAGRDDLCRRRNRTAILLYNLRQLRFRTTRIDCPAGLEKLLEIDGQINATSLMVESAALNLTLSLPTSIMHLTRNHNHTCWR